MARPIEPAVKHRRQLDNQRRIRKKAEFEARRIATFADWYVPRIDACTHALEVMGRTEKKLATMGIMLLFPIIMASAQVPVVSDTNMLKLIPPGVKVEWRTNLYEAETHTFVTTNWMPVGPPIDIKTNGVVIARRQHEAATLLTNVVHTITHAGIERRFVVSQTTGPVLATRHYDFPPPMDTPPFLAVPLRQQR